MSSYTSLKIERMVTGQNTTTWGDVTNTNWDAINAAVSGTATVTFASANKTLTWSDDNGPQDARNIRLFCTGNTGGSTKDLTLPDVAKLYLVYNDCLDSIRVKSSGTLSVTIPASKSTWVYAVQNGVVYDIVDATNYLSTLSLGTPLATSSGGTGTNAVTFCNLTSNVTGVLPTANGGTGSNTTTYCNLQANVTGVLPVSAGGTGGNTEANARTSLGATTVGGNMFTLVNPSAITFPRFNADNTVSALDAASFRTAIGAGTGGGSVTLVNGTGTVNGLTLSGSVNTSGNLTLSGDITSVNASATVNGFVIGYRNVPRSTTSTTLVTGDVGKCVAVSANITLPNATFSAGDTISIYNNTASNVTIIPGTGFTLYLAGSATTGNRTLSQRGIATIWCNSASDGVISGGGLT